MQDDSPRLLHKRLEHGYTSVPALSAHGEPEAVDEAEQSYQTAYSHMRQRSMIMEEWLAERSRMLGSVQRLQERPWSRLIREDLKAIRAALDRIQRSL